MASRPSLMVKPFAREIGLSAGLGFSKPWGVTKAGKSGTRPSSSAAGGPAPSRSAERHVVSPWRRRWWRLLLAGGIPAFVLSAVELALWLAGAGVPTSFWVAGGQPGIWRTNPDFARQFFAKDKVPQPYIGQLTDPKPAGVIRIFILGESAAMGTPDPAFGFGRMLEIMLREQYPERKFEVINAAMRGIDSHVLRRIAMDCARREPDLFILYAGNNEGIGLHCPDPQTRPWELHLGLIRLSQWCKSTRLGQTLRSLGRQPTKDGSPGMDYYRQNRLRADDARYGQAGRNFAANLRDICALGGAELPKVAATVAVNLTDCPPLGSLHRANLTAADLAQWEALYEQGAAAETAGQTGRALELFQAAAAIDDHFADLHFRLARTFRRAGSNSLARTHFRLARDWDALPFRATSRLNEIIRQVGREFRDRGVFLSDVERAFEESPWSEDGLPGRRLFYEHVHPTMTGTWLLAQSVYPQVTQALARILGPPVEKPPPSVERCARALAFTKLDEYNIQEAIARLIGSPPFLDQLEHAQRQAAEEQRLNTLRAVLTEAEIQNSVDCYLEAIRARPDDWPTRFNLAQLYQQVQRPQAALEHLAWLVEHYPWVSSFHLALANTLLAVGRVADATQALQRGLQSAPNDAALRSALEKLPPSP